MGSAAIMAHHAVATLSLVGALVSRQAHGYTLLLLATELTTPFINARWQLDALVGPPCVTVCVHPCMQKKPFVHPCLVHCATLERLNHRVPRLHTSHG